MSIVKSYPLIKPHINQAVKDRVCEVLDTGFLTEGKYTQDFEDMIRDYVTSAHALAFTSCTTGLEVALRALGTGPGDEVIVPDYTYPATADAVAIVGADAVVVDIDPATMLIDYDAIEKAVTHRTKVILPVSLFGNPLDYDRLNTIKDAHCLSIIEDAACSLGARYRDIPVGKHADITVFSLHPRKFITTGEGGMVTTDNDKAARWMRSYKHFGMGYAGDRASTIFERIGTNYKLSNVLAAIGLVQMEVIDELLDRRIALAENYTRILEQTPQVTLPATTSLSQHSYQSYCIFIQNRDAVMASMREKGIEVQIGTYCLHMHSAFRDSPRCRFAGELTASKKVFDTCLTLPLYHELTGADQAVIIDELVSSMDED